MGVNIKKSFGTALKPVSVTNITATMLLSVATVGLFYLATPRADLFVQTLANHYMYDNIRYKLWPKERWFHLQLPSVMTNMSAAWPRYPRHTSAGKCRPAGAAPDTPMVSRSTPQEKTDSRCRS
jgi:hypothetical protein